MTDMIITRSISDPLMRSLYQSYFDIGQWKKKQNLKKMSKKKSKKDIKAERKMLVSVVYKQKNWREKRKD